MNAENSRIANKFDDLWKEVECPIGWWSHSYDAAFWGFDEGVEWQKSRNSQLEERNDSAAIAMICPVCQSNIQLSMYSGEGKGSGALPDGEHNTTLFKMPNRL